MTFLRSLLRSTILATTFAVPAFAQLPSIAPPSHSIRINVEVDTKAGQPVSALRAQDFTLLDNKVTRPITSFKIVTPAQEPVHVIVLIDAVNTWYTGIAYVRQNVDQFLKLNEGTLAYPTSLAVLTDQGAQILNGFSTDGHALEDVLDHHDIGLREINRTSEWGGPERMQICLDAFHQLLAYSARIPGRKLVLWISPGWPLISGPRIYLTAKEENWIFEDVLSAYTQLRQNDLTIYNINPIGATESLVRTDYYQSFLKGVTRPNDVQPGDLGVQVLAIHSGGLAIESNSDVAGMIQKCLTDAHSWYEITFDPPPSDKPNQYHHLDVRLDQRDMTARTIDGYYANLQAVSPGGK